MFIIFYGNCQVMNLNKFLKLEKLGHEIKSIDCACFKWEKQKFVRFIRRANIIIMSYIKPNFRDLDFTSTEFMVKNCNPNATLIILPSVYFPLYHNDALRLKITEKDCLIKPEVYHYKNLIDCFLDNKTPEYYINNFVNNSNLLTKDELYEMATNNINELKNREKYIESFNKYRKVNVIKISEYIKKYYNTINLFHTYNHPTPPLYLHVVEQIARILNIKKKRMNLTHDPLIRLGKSLIYDCVQNVVEFDINENNNDYVIKKYGTINNMVEQYYLAYKKPENQKYIDKYIENKNNTMI